ncbi:MAG: hypothetical protein ACRDNF_25710 [Streptosporangiaceae bacterium]
MKIFTGQITNDKEITKDYGAQPLSTFIDFFLCGGQRQVATLGYSPLPKNLVQGGLLQSGRIPGQLAGPTGGGTCGSKPNPRS